MVSATTPAPPRRVAVVVLGELARSPRMRRHAECLAAAGVEVDVIGYVDGAAPLPPRARIRVHPLTAPERWRVAPGVARLVSDSLGVVAALWRSAPDWVLVQNPPALHVLPIAALLCRWRGGRLMLDWHNFGWTMLALRRGRGSAVVATAGWLERRAARAADAHLCVSAAMRHELAEQCGIAATVFRDLPARTFVAAASDGGERRVAALLAALDLPAAVAADLRAGRAALLVSATSWSADEDFTLLTEALRLWSSDAAGVGRPHLVVVVSGRGPGRVAYEREMRAQSLAGVTVRTTWLCDDDYPRLLAAADLGLCFHRSSSGVDLPMKLADMLGAGLPACVLDYGPCLREVVRDGENAFLFATAADLAALWRRLLPNRPGELDDVRRRLRASDAPTWEEHWRRCVAPLLGVAAPERGD